MIDSASLPVSQSGSRPGAPSLAEFRKLRPETPAFDVQVAARVRDGVPPVVSGLEYRLSGRGKAVFEARVSDLGGGNVRACYVVRDVRGGHAAAGQVDPVAERQRSLERARTRIADRCIALGANHMVTLTFRENVLELSRASEYLRRFWREVRRKIPSWKFVGVAERQERGAWHYHLAVAGWQQLSVLRLAWAKALGEAPGATGDATLGSVQCKRYDVRPGRTTAQGIGRYIAKYLGKGLEVDERPRYGHHYVTSRGILIEEFRYLLYGARDTVDAMAWLHLLLDERGVGVRRSWYGAWGGQKGGVRSW